MAAPSKPAVAVRVVVNHIPQASDALHAAVVEQVKRSTLEVEKRSKELVPVRTGHLRRSITSQFSENGLRGVCGPSASYGVWVEFGSRGRAARPYMRPAARLVLPRFADQIRAILARFS